MRTSRRLIIEVAAACFSNSFFVQEHPRARRVPLVATERPGDNTRSYTQTIVVRVPADDKKHGGSGDDEEALLLVKKLIVSLLTVAW